MTDTQTMHVRMCLMIFPKTITCVENDKSMALRKNMTIIVGYTSFMPLIYRRNVLILKEY